MDSYNITVSVIIPVYNNDNTITRCVDSCIKQSYLPSEIIIVNNNSTDDSQLLIDQYILNHPSLIRFIYETKPCANAARNAGIKIAKGDWIQLLDADDELRPDKLSHQVALLGIQNNADLICSSATKYIRNEQKDQIHKELIINADIIQGLINSEAGITSSNLWKREALLSLNLFDQEITSSQEYFMMLEFFKMDMGILLDPISKTKIYVSEESISNTNNADRSLEIMINRINYYNKLMEVLIQKNKLNSNYKKEIISNINRSYCYNVIRYGHSHMSRLKAIKNKYEISPSSIDILATYAHQVYSMYTITKGLLKYPDFALNLIIRVGKLFLFK